ncbi:MAG: hypothetical protein ACJA2N_001542 [Salibacteraceae bacterium]|jgi:hypothetical protein
MRSKIVNIMAISFSFFIGGLIYTANTGGTILMASFFQFLPYPDKCGHLMLFGILTLLVNWALKFKRFPVGSFQPYLGSVLVSFFVLLEELSQGFIVTRSMDYWDLLADAVGIILFSGLTRLLDKKVG